MEPSAVTEMSQKISMLTLAQDNPRPLYFIGGPGGPGGTGYHQGIGGSGGPGSAPTVHINAHQLIAPHLEHAEVTSEASQQRKIRAAQSGNHCPPPSRIFQGRKDILQQMHVFFTSDTGTQKVYLLHGLGGAGKTQIALKFIKDSSYFSDIFFIDASTITTIDTGLKNIAIIKDSGDLLQEGLLWLTSQVQAWLLVFDNADDPSIDLKDFIPECDHGNIIITSRNPGLCVHAGSDSRVSDMEEQDAVALLLKSAAQQVTAGTEKIATEIIKVRYLSYGHSIGVTMIS
ncbi:Nephrocystin-3 [Mycena sanguinolenta]|uniref:Nephrocystin-3 n=1 Tax=Mycena sanguinolenta TaxID=230812 RepID=A0A8H6YQA2_9AGAR|nr:Nephrocystin-3 [Mycena sanguinolenta]